MESCIICIMQRKLHIPVVRQLTLGHWQGSSTCLLFPIALIVLILVLVTSTDEFASNESFKETMTYLVFTYHTFWIDKMKLSLLLSSLWKPLYEREETTYLQRGKTLWKPSESFEAESGFLLAWILDIKAMILDLFTS